jgi:diguanylate cyclase (GGDEF)-like protein
MDFNANFYNERSWNRKLLNLFWIIFSFKIIVSVIYIISFHQTYPYIKFNVIIPTLCSLLVMVLLETSFRLVKRFLDYIIISGSCIICFISMYNSNFEEKTLILNLMLPILSSAFYFQRKKITASITLSIVLFGLLYVTRLAPLAHYSLSDVLGLLPILSVICYIVFAIVGRGRALLANLKEASESHQELMIQNILMDKLSKMDALTDLYNHITFHEYLEKLIEQSESAPFSIHVAVLDVDNFKKVNDTYGHRAGDTVLKSVSAIIKKRIGLNDFAARYGGEEFSIIFTEKSMTEVFELLEKIRWKISQTSYEELNGNAVTISIGLSEYAPGSGKEELFKGADKSLYKAKKSGKNKTVIYFPETEANIAN